MGWGAAQVSGVHARASHCQALRPHLPHRPQRYGGRGTRENGKSVSPRSTWDTQTKVLSTVKEMRSGRTRKTEKQSKDIQIEQVVDTRQMT